jgi:hypothetical protein
VDLEDAADDSAIREHIEVVIILLAQLTAAAWDALAARGPGRAFRRDLA